MTTSSQTQQSGGLIVSSQPILPRVVPTYQRLLLSSMPSTSNKPVLVAPGLPSVPQMIDKIKRGEYIYFNKLPLARGLSKFLLPHPEGQLVIVQADDLAASRKLIPNFEAWSQCFAIYTAVRIANGHKADRRDGLRPKDPCKKYNNNDGICSYGAKCKFAHKCFSCGGSHPYSRCSRRGKDQSKDRRSKQP